MQTARRNGGRGFMKSKPQAIAISGGLPSTKLVMKTKPPPEGGGVKTLAAPVYAHSFAG
jgi:hypothetical protein